MQRKPLELVFGSPNDAAALIQHLDSQNIAHKSEAVTIDRYSADSTSSLVQILTITVPTAATLLAPFLHEYVNKNKANWFANKNNPSNHITNDTEVKAFLANLEE